MQARNLLWDALYFPYCLINTAIITLLKLKTGLVLILIWAGDNYVHETCVIRLNNFMSRLIKQYILFNFVWCHTANLSSAKELHLYFSWKYLNAQYHIYLYYRLFCHFNSIGERFSFVHVIKWSKSLKSLRFVTKAV